MRDTPRRLAVLATASLVTAVPAIAAAPAARAATLPAAQSGAEAYLRPADGVFDVVGGGYGHGVGMSQYGAQGAATKGLTYQQILGFYYPGTHLVSQAPETIKIGITVDDDGIVQVGARPGLAFRTGSMTTTLPTAPTQWRVRATGTTASSCVLESYSASKWTVYRNGQTPCPVTFSNSTEGSVDLFLPGGERRVYRGTVTAHHHGTTELAAVNTLSTQDYLRGVVPSEMPPSWRLEALKSQAVAARTYAATRSKHTDYYDTCDTTSCQVYKGRGKRLGNGDISSYEWSSTNTAIDATKGKVLTYRFSWGTGLATTMYSSSNGGQSVAGGAGHGYLVAKSDPYDGAYVSGRPHAWQASLPAASLEKRFGIARVERVQILTRDGHGKGGGRVLTVRVEGTTPSGAYTYQDTTGYGIRDANPWPANSDGLSSNYFTITPQATTPGSVTRIAGADRYATAAEASRAFPPGVEVVYVASGTQFPDALAGAARAAFNDGPLLLTQARSVPAATRDAMARLKPGRVVVLGGTGAVSASVAATLRSLTTRDNLERVGGADRYETAALLARYYPAGGDVAYLATGLDFPDALAGAALAGRDRAPVLLTTRSKLPATTASALSALRPDRIVVLGGTGAVSAGVATQLGRYARSGIVTRLAGSDRYGTAAAVVRQFASASSAYVPSGEAFPDALAAAAVAGAAGVPVVLTRSDRLPSASREQLTRVQPWVAYVLGGTGVVSNAVLAQVRDAIG
ncbi:MAG: cell wall-binding repeat-containing protein [Intrasporangium sp.]|uniref:cell wall-binding repeat-containing protein n=1 Tax=Intrasporangium sp. TaxID=1925024 RepID=UPI00264A0FF1|nr:cell wall-binding repeat-containing protein [Intrasporangium sp.]MDN5796685.1 cell wall-binding repeat-containing protein [Intrasporangium sp.]